LSGVLENKLGIIMKILVTGGAGFIGSHTVDALITRGYRVRVLDNLQKPVHLKGKPDYLNGKAEYVWGDVTKRSDLEAALKGVDAIYHFAAYQDYLTDFSTFFHVNSVGTALIYEIIVEKKLPIKKIIVASSQFVQGEGVYLSENGDPHFPKIRSNDQMLKGQWAFSNDNGVPFKWQWTDETYASPPNQYAMSKYSQELMAMNFGDRYDIPSVALRYSIVQGSRQSFYNAYSGACRIFSLSYYFDKAPVIYEDGLMCRDFVNINDVVEANIIALEDKSTANNVYCVGGGRAYTVKQFAIEVSKIFGREELKPIIPGDYRFGDTRHACSDISKFRELGWSPKKNIRDSISEYKSYIEAQSNIEDILDYAEKQMKNMNIIRRAINI
jgi:dTDP-L-rhamnose 4-epimerase